ncbi:phosphoribosyltransferase-like protein [Citrobacter braakii]|uniref:phosphoribosyltransferase-like protein n=1 Tax=Citrobacter braakii TaxID=57706 RepID=UPI0005440804|nr:hypothetical protein [Citrobacter braakii]KHE07951.1 hypothetical protein IB70_04795 [Citrobacter braakii]
MDKNIFSMIFKLQKKQPWLSEKENQLTHLLYEDCQSPAQRELLIELLDRFLYLENKDFNAALNHICDQLIADPTIDSKNTQLVSLTTDNFSDSGQYILYALKSRLEKRGWREHLLINRSGSSFKEFNRNGQKHTNIIFIDEYIGSGSTVLNQYNTLTKQYGEIKTKIKSISIAASSVGLYNLKEKNIECFCVHEIKRGISDYYHDRETIDKNLSLMDNLEDILSQNYNDRALPKNGYGNTESLYSREDGNTPNSVFPIFWWPFYRDNKSRDTLLFRAMRDA